MHLSDAKTQKHVWIKTLLFHLILTSCWSLRLFSAESGPGPTGRLPYTNLMVYRDPSGTDRPVTSGAQWRQRREYILESMQEVMGSLPGPEKACDLKVTVISEADMGTYVRRDITYQSEPGGQVPAYLLIPKGFLDGTRKGRTYGILCLHQTHPQGRKVVVGLGNSPDDEYGVELVQRGYVCLAPAYPHLVDYEPDLKKMGYASGTMKAIHDNRRGLDVLASLPFVHPEKMASIGHSLGGHNTLFTAVFDERIKVAVSSCGMDSFRDYMDGNITGWTSHRYMPRLKNFAMSDLPFDFPEVLGAIAPRAVFISAPEGDANFKWTSVDRVAHAARPVFELLKAGDQLTVKHPKVGHQFPRDTREEAYQWIERVLGKPEVPITPAR